SASTLSLIRGAWQGERQWPKQLLVLADPVFEANDPRLGGGRANRAPATPAAAPNRPPRRDAGAARIQRLIGSRSEAMTISALAGSADVALGFDASRARAMEGGVKDH